MTNPNLKLVAPTTILRKVMPIRPANETMRTREYLTETEVAALLEGAKAGRHDHRDYTMILVAYQHGLRASELCDLRWDQIELNGSSPKIHVRRVKNGAPSVQRLSGEELRALRRLQREQEASPYVFTTERRGPFTTGAFAKIVERAGREAGLSFKAHPHMLRHARGYYLANHGIDTRTIQDYLGHKNIQHTVRYTQLSAAKFKAIEELDR